MDGVFGVSCHCVTHILFSPCNACVLMLELRLYKEVLGTAPMLRIRRVMNAFCTPGGVCRLNFFSIFYNPPKAEI